MRQIAHVLASNVICSKWMGSMPLYQSAITFSFYKRFVCLHRKYFVFTNTIVFPIVMSSRHRDSKKWSKYAETYDPVRVGSIDGTDTCPHDNGIVRAINSHYKPDARVVGNAKHTIFVGRLHLKTDEETLLRKFRRYGKILHCRLVRDTVTGISKQYAFIEYETTASACDAVHDMDKRYIDDTVIIVDYEHERRLKGWKPRRLGGGFSGKKESGQLRFGCRARPFQRCE